jgi:TatD DNase family protein
MLIDTHAHVNFQAFADDAEEVISDSLKGGVAMINVGSCRTTSERAIHLARPLVWASVGLHPIHIDREEFDFGSLAEHSSVVAIGETGLDYFHKPKTTAKKQQFKDKQEEIFRSHLDLARSLNKPVIFHCRYAHEEMLDILKEYDVPGVIHCYTGNLSQARRYLEMGLYLGFNGIIFKHDMQEVIEYMPGDRILLETDSPYLHPSGERNTPLFVKEVLKKINRDIDTTANACRLFKIEV